MSDTVPVAEARDQFSRLVARVEQHHERVTVTRNGREVAVLVSPDDLASLEETVAVLTDPDLMAQLSSEDHAPPVVLDHAEAQQRWSTNP